MSGSPNKQELKQENVLVDKERQGGVVGQGELYSPDYAIRKRVDENPKPNNEDEKIGQGELYSPNHAVKLPTKNHNNRHHHHHQDTPELSSIKWRMGLLKDKLIEKLSDATATNSISSMTRTATNESDLNDQQNQQKTSLENAKSFIETIIRDVGQAAQGRTKDALQRIKSHLADIFPSLSPSLTSKIVDDAENEAINEEISQGGREDDGNEEQFENQNQGNRYVNGKIDRSPASSSSLVTSVSLIPVVSKL